MSCLFPAQCFAFALIALNLSAAEAECTEASLKPLPATGWRSSSRSGYIGCPAGCKCSLTPSVSVDCSGAHLERVPTDLPADTVELNLDDNGIAALSNASLFACSKLRKLSVRSNRLSRIDSDAFSHVAASLEELHLEDNDLVLNDSHSIQLFSKLNSLLILSIQNNGNISDAIFAKLIKLTRLSLDRSKYVKFGLEFERLHNLSNLAIYGKIRIMLNDSLDNLRKCPITDLNIKSQNTLYSIAPFTFANLPQLETLDLSDNEGIDFIGVSKAWYGLRFTQISALIFSRIVAEDDFDERQLTKGLLKDLQFCTTIRKLVLSKNRIFSVEYGVFATVFPNLTHMDLSYNRIRDVAPILYEIYCMAHVTFADFGYQTKRYLNTRDATDLTEHNYTNSFGNPVNLKDGRTQDLHAFECKAASWKPCQFGDMSQIKNLCQFAGEAIEINIEDSKMLNVGPINETISELQNPFSAVKQLKNNVHKRGHYLGPDFGPWCIPIPRNLEVINLSDTLDVKLYNVPQLVLLGGRRHNGHLTNLVLRGNGISAFTGPFVTSVTNLSWSLDLSDNGATCLAPDMLRLWVERGGTLSKLLFENNNIADQLEHDLNGSTFQHYGEMSKLNLARNNIKLLPFNIFYNLTNLEHLNLSGNFLRLIEFKLLHLKRLRLLDLSQNLIANVDAKVRSNLSELFISSNMILDLVGNPIQCSCETLEFLQWTFHNKANINKFDNLVCLFNGTQVSFDKLSDIILVRLQLECSSSLIAVISATLLGTVLLAVVLSVFLYRHRWDIRYLFFNLRKKRDRYQLLQERSVQFVYDAFVSFDHKDSVWVRSELMRHLETSTEPLNLETSSENNRVIRPLRLCIHQRDFQVGGSIVQNILTAIEQSRKVILVLSRDFLSSHWCNFELEMGRMQSLDRGRNILVPIMLESLEMADMPSCLQWLVRRNTYIRWNEDECPADREEFWARLRRVINDSGLEPWICECGKTIFDEGDRENRSTEL